MAVTNTFTAKTRIKSAEVNQNFTDLADKVIYFPCPINNENGNFNWARSTQGTSYVPAATTGLGFYFNKTSNIASVKLYLCLINDDAGHTTTAQLYNITDDAVVSGTVTAHTGTASTWYKSSDILSALGTGEKEYTIQVKDSDAGLEDAIVSAAFLVVTYK